MRYFEVKLQQEAKEKDSISGLSFDELNEILQTKGLLDKLDDFPPHLGREFGVSVEDFPTRVLRELSVLGVLKINPRISSAHYELTEAGQIFFNRLEAKRLSMAGKETNKINSKSDTE